MARPLKKKDIVLSNEVKLEALPINKSKGRHWRATQRGRIVGEFMTWQQTTYTRQRHGDYGRGGGEYHAAMRRRSWLSHLGEPEIDLTEIPSSYSDEMVQAAGINTERQFYEWKSLLRNIPHPLVKKIAS